eukprot:Phypoly_transcript_15533.p1 GENE.Phypoly_transcript_15533~~Phypoly_transcript_15533.p1  ORF type:complete len:286 (+),score=47.50 Phypoly_transcript_15533:33-890(+)
MLGLVTSAQFPTLTHDDSLLLNELRGRNIDVEIIIWNEPNTDWSRFALVIIRTPWDYIHKYEEFVKWIEATSAQTRILNAPSVLLWNVHKRYLAELPSLEIPCVPTVVLEAGKRKGIDSIMRENKWNMAVVKPAVGAFATDVHKIQSGSITHQQEKHMKVLLEQQDMLVQPFISSVKLKGEISLIFIDGKYVHAVHKIPPQGDFKVQGGKIQPTTPTPAQIQLAKKTVSVVQKKGSILYARIDILFGQDDELLVSEVEVLDPELFFRYSRECVLAMADAICLQLK